MHLRLNTYKYMQWMSSAILSRQLHVFIKQGRVVQKCVMRCLYTPSCFLNVRFYGDLRQQCRIWNRSNIFERNACVLPITITLVFDSCISRIYWPTANLMASITDLSAVTSLCLLAHIKTSSKRGEDCWCCNSSPYVLSQWRWHFPRRFNTRLNVTAGV